MEERCLKLFLTLTILSTLFCLEGLFCYSTVAPLLQPVVADNTTDPLPKCPLPFSGVSSAGLLLVLATTMNVSYSSGRQLIHESIIRNWGSLHPWILPVLLVDPESREAEHSSYLLQLAENFGWQVRDFNSTRQGWPIFKNLVLSAANVSASSPFVGYANADIIFGFNFIETLDSINQSLTDARNTEMLVTGIRRNWKFSLSLRDVCPSRVELYAQRCQVFAPRSADFFIFSRAGFRWSEIPDMVIGIPNYDGYIMSKAVYWNISFIETTDTVSALHLQHSRHVRKDKGLNHQLMTGMGHSSSIGSHNCSNWRTSYTDDCQRSRQASCVQLHRLYNCFPACGCH